MKVRLRYFASVREALGEGESIELGAGATVASARAALVERDPAHAEALGPRSLRFALNRVLCDDDAPLTDGDELAFFPPVTGG